MFYVELWEYQRTVLYVVDKKVQAGNISPDKQVKIPPKKDVLAHLSGSQQLFGYIPQIQISLH